MKKKLFILIAALAFAGIANAQIWNVVLTNGTNPSCPGAQVTLRVQDQSGNSCQPDHWTCSGNCPSGSPFGFSAVSVVVTPTVTTTYRAVNPCFCGCSTSPYTVTVTPTPAAAGTITGTSTVCQGQNNIPYSVGAITNATSYGWTYSGTGFSIASGSGTNSITATFSNSATSGDLTVRGINSCGNGTNSSNYSITVNPLPTATITPSGSTTFCQGGNVTLNANTCSGCTYLWSTNATTQSIVASSAGNYSVTVTNSSGCSATSSATTVTVNSLPTANITASGATTFCQGNSITLTASSANSYLWSNSATMQNITVSSSGNYSVTVTDGNGCSATSSPTTVTVNSLPIVTISSTNVTCNGGNDGSALVNVSGGQSPYSYSWSNGQTTSSATNLSAATYTITVTDSHSCTKSATVAVTQPNPLSVNITPASPSICNGSSVTLSAGFGYSSYSWTPTGQTIPTIIVSPTATTTYSVTVSDVNGCTGAGATTVTVNQPPFGTINVFANGQTTFCQGDSVILFAPAGYSTYLWSPGGQTTSSSTVYTSGNYSVTVTDGNGCSATSSPTAVTVNPLPTAIISASGATTFCQGNNVTLTSSSGSSYLWSNNATTQSIIVSVSGNYSVTVTNSNGCSASSSATTVTVNPNPSVFITGNTIICSGDVTTLTATGGGTYSWSTGATTPYIYVNPSSTTSYSVIATNVNGCTDINSATVNVAPLPVSSISQNNCTLTASGGGNYSWSTGATTPSITVSSSGTYSVIVTIGACSDTASINITCVTGIANSAQQQNELTIIPNPSSGEFTIQVGSGQWAVGKEYKIEIYNVLGEKIYSSQINSNKSEINLSNQPQGIYFLQVKTNEGIINKKLIKQ